MKPKTENTVAGADEGMGLYDGVHCMRLSAGQVLIYRGHTAPGVFVFLSGCVHSGARVWRSNDADQPFLVVPEVSGHDPACDRCTATLNRQPGRPYTPHSDVDICPIFVALVGQQRGIQHRQRKAALDSLIALMAIGSGGFPR